MFDGTEIDDKGNTMIGRDSETQSLKSLYRSGQAELVAVYGRRRVGKTYLISETFKTKLTFHHAGLSPVEMETLGIGTPLRKQLKHFYNSLIFQGMKKSRCPATWLDAFLMLELFLQEKDRGERQVVFLDELPWMDTQKSGFITAFEGFWNTWGCYRDNLMVIVCGSAISWIQDKLINNHGGLYGRLTYSIKLSPFTLYECEEFLQSRGVKISRYDIVQAYMITGGIPYYLKYFEKGKSLAQNIDQMFFRIGAPLRDEYERLMTSSFARPEKLRVIIECLATKNAGYSKPEIENKTNFSRGGNLSKDFNALIASDFIVKYKPFKEKSYRYKLVDPFCLFYLRFAKDQSALDNDFWQQNLTSSKISSWRGFAFENVCFNYISEIKKALGISGVSTKQSIWTKRSTADEDGTQVDLIIERKDDVVNMCEIKYYKGDFVVDKSYHRTLVHRRNLLEKEISRKDIIHSTLITTNGLEYNEYSSDFDNVITLDDLFER